MTSSFDRIALFGTSADPPHQGHGAVLAWLNTQFDHVAVWVSDNPFKQHQSSLGDRRRMLELLIDELGADRVQLHAELSHMRTIVTLERAREIWPQAAFTLVVGADLVPQLPSWYRAEDLFAAVDLLVVPRPGYPLKEADVAELRRRTQVEIAAIPQQHDVSSTQIRQDEAAALPPAVEAYIHQHNLYPCPEDSREKLSMR
ncbi:nicotinic acid mononucleotide adenylyltransferase [filamentous cyanobacterium CCP5]|nr:nicotinic acid mononucleotide adenylyltransferase [filamentous cyanobacterium CCP5]